MIPEARSAWRPANDRPLGGWHPAARLGAGVLAVLSALLLPALALGALAIPLGWLLWRAGWRPAALGDRWRAWLPLLVIVLAAHTLSAVDAAPLGRPSGVGFARGLLALGRLALMLAAAGLSIRLLPLPDLGAALAWWLRPLRPLGLDDSHLHLVLAVAAGTAPRTLGEAARLQDCLRLRCADGRPRRGLRLRERWLVMPPLMEGLVRRAETLPLALVGRVPQSGERPARLPAGQALLLAAWAALLVVAVRV